MKFQNLRKSFGGHTVLDGVSGEIHPGDVILLRGENGSGKTTLLNILTGCLKPDSGTIEIAGSPKAPDTGNQKFTFPRAWCAWWDDWNPFQRFTPERVARLGIGRTWQDVRLFGSLDLADNIAAAVPDDSDSPWVALCRPRRTGHANRLQRRTAAETLSELGLPDRSTSSADKISLGQSKRVAIARALHARARILFLDEPLSGLDADGVRDVISHLRTLATDHGLSIVIVEHVLNIPRLLDFVTTCWTLKYGKLTTAKPAAVHEELASTASAANIHNLIRQALKREVPLTTQTLPQGAKLTTYWLADLERSRASAPVLEVDNLTLQRGLRSLFADSESQNLGLSFQIWPNTLNILEAPNGWGKSSLLLCLTNFLNASSGHYRLNEGSNSEFSQSVTALTTDNTLFPNLTVTETCLLGKQPQPGSLDPTRRVSSLSGGERQKLAISCLRPSSVSILDEFLHGLDFAASIRLLKQIMDSSQESCLLWLEPTSQHSIPIHSPP